MSATVLLDVDQLRSAIQDEYAEVAACPLKGFHFHTGRFLAARLGYPEDRVVALPDAVVESFAGVGNPFAWGEPVAGETVLDLGSGAGFDLLQAAAMVGPTGRAIGVDMTPAMLEKARANAALLGLGNVEVREGYLEALPVEDATASTSSSPTASSTSARTRRRCWPRRSGCSSRAAGCSSRTSSSPGRCRRTVRRTSPSGPAELPVLSWKESFAP